MNRVLLLTDGLANAGITDSAQLERHAAGLRVRGVSTSTFGLGDDFDERLLGAMADAGGGAFRFIGKPEEIPALIGSEVGELLEVTARDVELRISGPDGLLIECLSPFPLDRGQRASVLRVGDLVADQVVRFILVLGFPLGEAGRDVGVEMAVADRGGRLAGSATLTWTFADGEANDRQPRDREVDRAVARTYADRALRDAVDLNRRGAWDEARAALRAVAKRDPRLCRAPTRCSAGSLPSLSARPRRGRTSGWSGAQGHVLAVGLRAQVAGRSPARPCAGRTRTAIPRPDARAARVGGR